MVYKKIVSALVVEINIHVVQSHLFLLTHDCTMTRMLRDDRAMSVQSSSDLDPTPHRPAAPGNQVRLEICSAPPDFPEYPPFQFILDHLPPAGPMSEIIYGRRPNWICDRGIALQ